MATTKRRSKKTPKACSSHGRAWRTGKSKAARSKGSVGLNRCRHHPEKFKTKKNGDTSWRVRWWDPEAALWRPWGKVTAPSADGALRKILSKYPDYGAEEFKVEADSSKSSRKAAKRKTKKNHHGGYHAPGDPLGYKANPRMSLHAPLFAVAFDRIGRGVKYVSKGNEWDGSWYTDDIGRAKTWKTYSGAERWLRGRSGTLLQSLGPRIVNVR